jgi:multidrug efflux pump subunit AcrA (membrane-fusion protein)
VTPAGSEPQLAAPSHLGADLERLRIDRSSAATRRRGRARPWIVAGAVVLAFAGILWATMGEELLAPPVKTARAQRVAATEGAVKTSASGYVVPRRRAAISTRMSGRLERLTVDVGDDVTAGQLLGELGHADLDAAVLEAKAAIAVRKAEVDGAKRQTAAAAASAESAKLEAVEFEPLLGEMESRLADADRTLAREKVLKQGGASTQEALDRAQTERDVAARRVDQLRARLDTKRAEARRQALETEAAQSSVATAECAVAAAEAALSHAQAMRADADIVAPFAGRVLRKEAEIGEMVSPVNAAGSTTRGAIVTLADFATLEMEVDVIERDIRRIEPGAPCRILLDSRRESPYAGVVRQIVPTADRTKSTVQVKVSFVKLDRDVSPEMSGRVEFLGTDATEAVVLGKDRVFAPKAAIVTRGGKRGVFEVKERRAVFREIGLPDAPAEKDGATEIASGLIGGEDLVLDPPARLESDALVRPAEPAK